MYRYSFIWLAILFSLAVVTAVNTPRAQANSISSSYEKALRAVDADTNQYPYTYQGRMALAELLAEENNYDSAIKLFDRLLEDHPDDPDLLLLRGRTHAWKGNLEQAERDLRTVLRENPSYPDAWQILGNVYRWSDRSDSAVEAYTKWIDLEPDQAPPYLHRGKIHRNQGQYNRAASDFRTARKKGADPTQIPFLRPSTPNTSNPTYDWRTRIGYRHTELTQGRDNWTRYHASIERTFDRATVILETFRARHFKTWNTGLSLDTYWDLKQGRYLNVRYQTSPEHDFLPHHDLLVEGYHPLGSGWEGSLGFRTMDFNNTDVRISKLGLGRYWGQWYARWVLRNIRNNTSSGLFHTLSARRYLSESDHFMELRGGFGDEVVEVSPSNPAGTLNTHSLGARYQVYFDGTNGMNLDLGYVAPDGQPIRRSVTLEYLRRW